MKTYKKFIILVIVLIVVFFLYYLYALNNLEVTNITAYPTDMDLSGFTLQGDIELYNPNFIPVGFDYIEYSVVLERNRQVLGHGRMDGGTINAGEKKSFAHSTKIDWIPASALALSMITDKDTNIEFSGNVKTLGGVYLPFSKRVDIGDYVNQFIQKKAEEVIQKGQEIIGGITEGIKETGESIAGNITKAGKGIIEGIGEFFGF